MLKWWRRSPVTSAEELETPGHPSAAEPQFGAAPGTQIHYNPELPTQLAGEHHKIMGIIDAITEAENGDDYHQVSSLIRSFSTTVRQHFLTENTQFYTYLGKLYTDHAELSQLVREAHREANAISRMVSGFLNDYRGDDWDHHLKCRFRKDLHLLRHGLKKRIYTEESELSLLYMEPGTL